jgi:hypothetical protein
MGHSTLPGDSNSAAVSHSKTQMTVANQSIGAEELSWHWPDWLIWRNLLLKEEVRSSWFLHFPMFESRF